MEYSSETLWGPALPIAGCETRHQMMEWHLCICTRRWWNILQKMNESCQRPVLATKQRSKISWCNIRCWWSENSHIVFEHVRECPKMISFVLWTVLKCTDLSCVGESSYRNCLQWHVGIVLKARAIWRRSKRFWTWQGAIIHLVSAWVSGQLPGPLFGWRSSLSGLRDLYVRPLSTFYCGILWKMRFTFSQCL